MQDKSRDTSTLKQQKERLQHVIQDQQRHKVGLKKRYKEEDMSEEDNGRDSRQDVTLPAIT